MLTVLIPVIVTRKARDSSIFIKLKFFTIPRGSAGVGYEATVVMAIRGARDSVIFINL